MLTSDIPWVAHGYRGASARKHFCNIIVDEDSNRVICSDEFGPGDTGYINPTPARHLRCATVVHKAYEEDYAAPHGTPNHRPWSARSDQQPSPIITDDRRIHSAGTMRTPAQDGLVRIGLTFRYQNRKIRVADRDLFSPDPGRTYFDRHSRCLNHDHVHLLLNQNLPHAACIDCGAGCQANEYAKTKRRTRPQTAPSTRKEYSLLGKTDILLSNIQPHFCNFVKKLAIHPRHQQLHLHLRPAHVPPVRHAFGGSDGEDELDGLESVSGSSLSESRQGAEARPTSAEMRGGARYSTVPSRRTTNRHKSALTTQRKKDIKVKPRLQPRPPSQPKESWIDTKDTDKTATTTVAAARGAHVPKVDPSQRRRRSPKKENKPKVREPGSGEGEQTIPPPIAQMAEPITGTGHLAPPETPVAPPEPPPEPEPEVTPAVAVNSPVPSIADLQPSSKVAPPSPKLLVDVRTTPRQSVHSKTSLHSPHDSARSQRVHSVGDGDAKFNETKNMKHAEMTPDDAILKKMIQQNANLAGGSVQGGRLALSKQSSRFELPMDMMTLETLTPQDYLRKYCVVSSRRQNLYHKMFTKNKEAKKPTLQMKELVKALKEVLTDTLDEAMLHLVLDMTLIDAETSIDEKLFSGVAALAERLLYAKFITEDTADLTDNQRERIECADFFALEWKCHGVNVNPPMERLLRSL